MIIKRLTQRGVTSKGSAGYRCGPAPGMFMVASLMVLVTTQALPPRAHAQSQMTQLGGSLFPDNSESASDNDGQDDSVRTSEGARALKKVFAVWKSVREAIRASPDHLPARAEALVDEGDPARIYQFVRNEIAVYPAHDDDVGGADAVDRVRWGIRGTLRGGAGTPREKVAVLSHLLRQAGFETTVMKGRPTSALDTRAMLMYRPARRFDPDVNEEQLETWQETIDSESTTGTQVIDPDLKQTRQLSADLRNALPQPGNRSAPFDFAAPEWIPLVQVKLDGETRYANPLVRDGEFGKPYTQNEPVPADNAQDTPGILVKLEAAVLQAPSERFTILSEQWRAKDLVGRRMELSFIPPADANGLGELKASEVQTLTPVLRVVGPHLAADESGNLSAEGDRLTVHAGSSDPPPKKRLSGLYLTIRVGDGPTLTRTLAGYAGESQVQPEVTETMLNAVEGMLFGRVSIRVEGAGPTMAVKLDDWFTAKLGLQSLWQAVQDGDHDVLVDALTFGDTLPPTAPLLLAGARSAPGEKAVGFEITPQLITAIQRPVFDQGTVRTVDLFPYSRYRSLAEDDDKAWRSTLTSTAYQAVAEDALLGTGTYTLLSDDELIAVTADGAQARLQRFSGARRAGWERMMAPYLADNRHTILIPTDGDPLAFWLVDDATGQVVGIMPDGTGGARKEITRDFNRSQAFIDIIAELGSLAGAGGAVGAFAALEKAKVQALCEATQTIAALPSSPGEQTSGKPSDLEDLRNIGKAFVWSQIKSTILGKIPGGDKIGTLDTGSSILGGLTGLDSPTLPSPVDTSEVCSG